jgi:MIP family channel proteins
VRRRSLLLRLNQLLSQPLARAMLGEILGTYLLVLFGTGAVATAVLTGGLSGLGQVAVVWAIGVALAIVVAAPLSGAHLNPAVSLAFALARPHGFPLRRWPAYVAAQLAGAVLAGATIAPAFGPLIDRFERAEGIVRGAPGSQRSAMLFGEYFPNPGMLGVDAAAQALVTPPHAAVVEGFGTAILVFVVFSLTSPHGPRESARWLIPPAIGLTVAALIMVFAPITQAGWNPARDFGPRLVAWYLGWGTIALPGPAGGFWVYIVGPLIGGPVGAFVWRATGLDRAPDA